jgi:hypothetical protein
MIAKTAQTIAINHPTVATPARAINAHGDIARRLRKAVAGSVGNFDSMFTELDTPCTLDEVSADSR